jgi:hypothetical protein
MSTRPINLALLAACFAATPHGGVAAVAREQGNEGAAFVAYYWKARAGRLQEYNDYIRKTAEPIDEDARKAGVFEEVRTVVPTPGPDGALPEWTHLRIFRLKNMAVVAQLGPGLDAATARVVSSEAQRKANTARSAELRDLLRREVWTELR